VVAVEVATTVRPASVSDSAVPATRAPETVADAECGLEDITDGTCSANTGNSSAVGACKIRSERYEPPSSVVVQRHDKTAGFGPVSRDNRSQKSSASRRRGRTTSSRASARKHGS
jgi:hypothetical protein